MNNRMDRFTTQSANYQRTEKDREEFLKREKQRHDTKLAIRDHIKECLQIENEKKIELGKLKVCDTKDNIERERKRK